MKQQAKLMFKKISLNLPFKLCILVLLGITIITAVWCGLVVSSIPLNKLNPVISSNMAKSKSVDILEEGSFINLEEIKTYLLFTERNNSIQDILPDLNIKKKEALVIRDIILSPLIKNECTVHNCFQSKMPFDQIPSVFWKGLIGIEDYRFLDHRGVDLKAIVRALIADIKQMRFAQGGSTLTQQLVKNLFLSQKKTIYRKLKEIVMATYIEYKFSKERILESYFNEVYWGAISGLKIKGLKAASIFYFSKHPRKLTDFEVSILISMLKGPGYYHPVHQQSRLKQRANYIYRKLVEINFFSSNTNQKWNKSQWDNFLKQLLIIQTNKPYLHLWDSTQDKSKDMNNYEKFVFYKKSNELLINLKEQYKEVDIGIKAASIKVNGSSKFLFYSKRERKKEVALTTERHQVGSTLKPIIYSLFLKYGKNLKDLVSTEKIELKLKSGLWSPSEAHESEQPEITLEEALLKSFNRPLIRVANEVGMDIIEKDLLSIMPSLKLPMSEYPAQLLGAIELSVNDLLLIYKKFIKDACRGNKNNLAIINVLSDPSKTTIGNHVDYFKNHKFFGKTGTSNKGFDNWYIYFDGNELIVIWVGVEKRIEKKLNMFGSTTSFRILKNYLRHRGKRLGHLSCDNI